MKRFFDIMLALVLIPFAVPLVGFAMLLIAIEMRAPPLFAQRRIGRFCKPFTIYKLRTMRPGTRTAASHEITSDAITPMGRFLRQCKFDELPQLCNVLLGDMSFVGPRPCLPQQRELIAVREARGIHVLRPGITGPAQLQGIDMSEPERLAKVDEIYLQRWSLAKDISIIVRTFLGFGSGDAVRMTGDGSN